MWDQPYCIDTLYINPLTPKQITSIMSFCVMPLEMCLKSQNTRINIAGPCHLLHASVISQRFPLLSCHRNLFHASVIEKTTLPEVKASRVSS